MFFASENTVLKILWQKWDILGERMVRELAVLWAGGRSNWDPFKLELFFYLSRILHFVCFPT